MSEAFYFFLPFFLMVPVSMIAHVIWVNRKVVKCSSAGEAFEFGVSVGPMMVVLWFIATAIYANFGSYPNESPGVGGAIMTAASLLFLPALVVMSLICGLLTATMSFVRLRFTRKV